MKVVKTEHTIRPHTLTFQEFLRLKKDAGPHEAWRSQAKAVNFGKLFGMSSGKFVETSLETSWTAEEAARYVIEYGLQDMKFKMSQRFSHKPPAYWDYVTAAEDIGIKFFRTYPGLAERIDREHAFAKKKGYIRSPHGAFKQAPTVYMTEYTPKGYPNPEASSLYGQHLANQKNITSNTAIQNLEASIVMPAIAEVNTILRSLGLKSYIFNSVHDSVDAMVHRTEIAIYAKILKHVCERQLVLFFGMPLEIEIDMSDPIWHPDEYYKKGRDVSVVLKEHNEKGVEQVDPDLFIP